MPLSLTSYCHSCHRVFVPEERRWRFTERGEAGLSQHDIPHFCDGCAARVGHGILTEVPSKGGGQP